LDRSLPLVAIDATLQQQTRNVIGGDRGSVPHEGANTLAKVARIGNGAN
jgi:hypothetical protein